MTSLRVMVFIDGSNLFRATERHRKGLRLDIAKLRDKLAKGRTLMRTYYYCSIGNPPRPEQIKFQDKLKNLHIEVVSKLLKVRPTGAKVEKGIDVALVTHMLSLASNNAYDVAVLVSGDNDFLGAVEEVKRLGKRVEIACFNSEIGRDLRMQADEFIPLDPMVGEITLK